MSANATLEAPVAGESLPVRPSNRRRHWKQKFDPNADFIFTRRLKLGLDPANPWVTAGDLVPRGTFHRNRLRVWWNAGFIAIKDWHLGMPAAPLRAAEPLKSVVAPPVAPVAPAVLEQGAPGAPEKLAMVESTGGGWFNVLILGDDSEPYRCRGRAEVDLFLFEHGLKEVSPNAAAQIEHHAKREQPESGDAQQESAQAAGEVENDKGAEEGDDDEGGAQ